MGLHGAEPSLAEQLPEYKSKTLHHLFMENRPKSQIALINMEVIAMLLTLVALYCSSVQAAPAAPASDDGALERQRTAGSVLDLTNAKDWDTYLRAFDDPG